MKQVLTTSRQLGPLIAARRKARKLSQKEVATKLGISQNWLSEVETDASTLPIKRLLDVLNVLGLDLVLQDRASNRSSAAEW